MEGSAVSGPGERLAFHPSLAAVKEARYRPCPASGEPAEEITTNSVTFREIG